MSASQIRGQNKDQVYLQGVAGQYAGQRVPVGETLIIGSDTNVQVSINDPAITPQHARIVPAGNRLEIENISGADDIWVNGAAVQKQLLNSGDEIRLGRQRFVVKIPGLRPDSVLRDIPAERGGGWLLWATVATATVIGVAAVYWYLLR